MSIFSVMKSRRSVRSFDGTPLTGEDRKRICDYAAQADNPYGQAIEWKLLDAEEHGLSSPVITGTDLYIAGKMRRQPHAEEAFGYAFEKIVLYAESLGIGTTWIAGTMNRPAFEKAISLTEEEVLPCVSPLGYPARKMTLRESMMRKGVRADSRLAFDTLFFDGSFDTPLSPDKAGVLKEALEAVRVAPSAVNKQPWRVVLCGGKAHFYEKRNPGYVQNGWDLQKIDVGIALCHFELAARERGVETVFEIQDPGIPVPEDVSYIASYAVTI
ncbi:MAG: nitroreductase [Clostridia bacterium]|nr:nitroreductase [Clostridia bacterium]